MGGRRAKSHLQIINDYYCYRDKEDWQRGRGDCCILYLPRGHCGKVLQLIKSLEAVLRLKQRCEEDSAGGKVAKIGETSCGSYFNKHFGHKSSRTAIISVIITSSEPITGKFAYWQIGLLANCL